MNYYNEVINRYKKDGIDYTDKHILIDGIESSLNGEKIRSWKLSKDEKWIAILIYDDEQSLFFGENTFEPSIFEVVEKASTFLGNGGVLVRSNIYVLQ